MTTENHEFNTPEEGAVDWHVPLNENFERIDSGVEIRDAEANRTQYTPKENAKFLATDTGRRFLGDGSQWVEAPPQPRDRLGVSGVDSDPTDPVPGEIWYRADTNTLRVKLANEVQSLATGPAVSDDTDSSSGSDGGSDSDSGGDTSGGSHTLEFVAAEGADYGRYSAVIDGDVTGTTGFDAGGDTVTAQSDGTELVEGGLKKGRTESVTFTGELLSVSWGVEGTVYLDGSAIDPANY